MKTIKRRNPTDITIIFDYVNYRLEESEHKDAKKFWKQLKTDLENSELTENSSMSDIKKYMRMRLALTQSILKFLDNV